MVEQQDISLHPFPRRAPGEIEERNGDELGAYQKDDKPDRGNIVKRAHDPAYCAGEEIIIYQ